MTNRQNFNFAVQRVSSLAAAMLLMVWGTMNFFTNALVAWRGHSVTGWTATVIFGLVFALIPFAIGVGLASHTLRKQT